MALASCSPGEEAIRGEKNCYENKAISGVVLLTHIYVIHATSFGHHLRIDTSHGLHCVGLKAGKKSEGFGMGAIEIIILLTISDVEWSTMPTSHN